MRVDARLTFRTSFTLRLKCSWQSASVLSVAGGGWFFPHPLGSCGSKRGYSFHRCSSQLLALYTKLASLCTVMALLHNASLHMIMASQYTVMVSLHNSGLSMHSDDFSIQCWPLYRQWWPLHNCVVSIHNNGLSTQCWPLYTQWWPVCTVITFRHNTGLSVHSDGLAT